ncbi:hypothetical protein A3B45_00295 [Candidatus Daviesbacteria bacterium RIFCSPLOWO2_01_FULL_39_12]|uniref:Glycosyltransferase 2-like domain-containing protein n=1 Tax=Candidatus Daviesbacteria bacterium RIFCSPLOWO2_01_FULL_39_12 TaxID=1797785 RepID=A0A1F5KNW9_9BACT|nr:MAG: hypothetical protein A3D79_00865 [Candidatus Daviesbacteria bacterium RIFCSPHIGHO2_02_FULL_39_8]OGE42633.1 MAG: hypothetical protein A3B45_00295 [Candidatus Daviesbacteria bacterium RIFCSPLOWO2_01_FULL_39_12]
MKIALVIFTKNERRNSEKMFPKIPLRLFDGIYVVDAKSNDGTRDFYKAKKIKVFDQIYPGVGGAYESAFRNTKKDALVIFHPDGNSDPKALSKMVQLLRKGEQFIIPSRMIKGAANEEDDQSFKYRKWSNQLMSTLVSMLWGRDGNKCSDLTQGYRAMTRRAYEKLNIKIPSPIAPDIEQVIRALKRGIKIVEFPTREGHRLHGKTSMPSIRTSIENLKVFFRELLV